MKRMFLVRMLILGFLTAVPMLSGGQNQASPAGLRGRFIGAWRLVQLDEPDADGKVHKADCTGLLVYSEDGHMSVQVMYRNPQSGNAGGTVQYAQGGYEASFGRYEINNDYIFTFTVDGALVRSLIGKDLKRAYELSGNRLTVKSVGPNEHWRVVWERF